MSQTNHRRNTWNMTGAEYLTACEMARATGTPDQDSADLWQLQRFYRGQIFIRDDAARGLLLVRSAMQRGPR